MQKNIDIYVYRIYFSFSSIPLILQMPQLEKKLVQELTTDGTVIACRFHLPTWPPCRTAGSGIDTVWYYTKTGLKS